MNIMNLSQREKLLAGGVSLVILLFVGNYMWESMRKAFDTKLDKITSLQQTKNDQALQITAGAIAKAKLNRVVPQSLPSNEERARAEYMKWLIELGDEVGLIDPQPRSLGETTERDLYQDFKFQLSGTGTIETATQLLYAFQSKDYLHRVLRFDLRPMNSANSPPNRLSIALDCEVLALKSAKPDQPNPTNNSPRIDKPLDAYKTVISGRNIFSPTNHPPRLATSRRVDATRGIRVDVGIDANDADPGQTLRYEFEGKPLDGMRLDPESGKLTWTSSEFGEYTVAVRATDSGIPARSTVQTVSIRVAEPPPPAKEPPKFDIASQAFVTALISDARGPAAWVRSKIEDKTIYLRQGDELKLGNIVGKVIEVRPDFIELETDGKRWIVGQDESIADAYKKSMED